jgi:serine/threonine-protein kinase RsbW
MEGTMRTNTETTRVVSLVIPAEARWLALCRLVLAGMCEEGGVDEETTADIKLAVTEACSNSIRHAYRDGGAGLVSVRYEFGEGGFSAEITDAGQGFRFDRPVRELGPDSSEDLREDEMGLAIIHALVDEIEVGAGPDETGTAIRFRKQLGRA